MQSYTNFFRTAGLVASTAFALTVANAADAEKPAADKDPLSVPTENSITITGQTAKVKGDKSAYQAENWTAKNGFAGIEDFQFSDDPAKDVTVKADGHLLAGQDDYLAHFNVAKTDIGSVDVGYKSFRTYYDNAGGFFLPTEGSWLPIFAQNLYVDRSKFWAEANLLLPNMPVVTIRYTNELRKGRKETTIWGASDFTGLSALSNSTSQASRYIAPGYLELAERHQALEGIVKKTFGKTTVEISAVGDQVDNLNTKVGNRYPGQLKIPAIAASPVTTVTPATIQSFNNAAVAYDRLNNKVTSYTASAKAETVFSAKLKAFAGVSYSTVNSDFTEERPLYTNTPYGTPATNFVTAYSSQAQGLLGTAKINTLTANVGLEYKLANNLSSELVIKGEDRYAHADDTYQTVGSPAVSATGVVTPAAPANLAAASHSAEKALTPELSLRYTGIKGMSLYGTVEYRRVRGDESVTAQYNTVTTYAKPTYSDVSENHGRYTFGANWAVTSFLTLRGETFYKDHQNDFRYNTNSTAFYLLGYKVKGARLSATFKPTPTMSLTTRYVYQTGKMDTESAVTANFQSMDSTSHNLGATFDWTPIKQFYMQFNLNAVFDMTSTAYPVAGAATATTSGNNAQRNADNNYLTGSVIAGFVVDKVTNAEIQYAQYRADNFKADYSVLGMPYGMSETNDTVTAGIKRKLTDKLIVNVKVGYMKSESATTANRANYTAKVAYVSLQRAF